MLCFLFEIVFFNQQSDTPSPVNAGLAVTITGIIISCMLIVSCAAVFAPVLFHPGSSADQGLKSKPPALAQKSQFEAWFILFATATIGNFTAGSFSTILSGAAFETKKYAGKKHQHLISSILNRTIVQVRHFYFQL